MKQYRIIGAGWNNEKGGIDLKLDNGMRLTLWKNERKEPGSRQPDWRINGTTELAQELGIEEREYTKPAEPASDEIDLSNLPF